MPIVTIDGPAGAGKTTTAREVARRLNLVHLDTGAMYRALALQVLRAGCPLDDPQQIARVVQSVVVSLRYLHGQQRVLLDDEDVTDLLRSAEVTHAVTPVCEVPEVRHKLVELQRQIGLRGGIVAEGRDLGTIVFPQADLKIFWVADIEERARRRLQEIQAGGGHSTFEEVVRDIQERDHRDLQRQLSPLKPAADAIVVDTTRLTFAEQVEEIIRHFRNRCASATA